VTLPKELSRAVVVRKGKVRCLSVVQIAEDGHGLGEVALERVERAKALQNSVKRGQCLEYGGSVFNQLKERLTEKNESGKDKLGAAIIFVP